MNFLKKNRWAIILFTLIIWGGFLRFDSLGEQSLWMDEGFSVSTANSILENGYPLMDSGSTSWRAFPVHYIMAIGLFINNDPQIGGRVFTALAGTLLILIFYLFNYQIFRSRRQAIIATALMTFMTYEIGWSRQARMYVFLQLFIITSLYFYYRFLEQKNKTFLILAFIFSVLSVYTHQAGYLAPLIILLTTLIDVSEFKEWWKWIKNNYKFSILFILLFGLFVYSLFLIKSDSSLLVIKKAAKKSFDTNYTVSYLKFLILELGLFLPVGVIGFFTLAWKKKSKYMLALTIGVASYFLLISFKNPVLNFRYLLPILPFIFIYIAYAFNQLFEKFKKNRISSSIFLSLFIILISFSGKSNFLPNAYNLGISAPQPDWKAGYEWIKNDAGDKEIITISTFPMFHDIYYGKNIGEKFYLPYSGNGMPGSFNDDSNYSNAEVINSLDELLSINGYLILDNYGLRMLRDEDVRNYLGPLNPTEIIKGDFDLMIWKINNYELST
ncbi:glycosyltransferase family 39 protein [Candidatus Peregrinibacteria bacterium]|nr:glycosyltransferase family 39 protein [Candidatus Peregrinibacteria bacterium]